LYADTVKQFDIEHGLTESEGVNSSNEGTFMKAPNGKPTNLTEKTMATSKNKSV
jgi:hypothetical protein